ncbi:adenylosuccinate lyase [Fructobacillus evanidus]|uniref:Adenylosuccinate lyase n=1 Tax=Fructobacillus evanidus TaxID=3064281 RepID=A0ABN9YTB0_9LACO|nr:Adenylosuccinate lyase (PurB) [Fructobacillus sp. LMG 32999]CAK1229987.1 Adenylosuccinate lyase (PurB) [Fructobacillus sp. LMG 32999]CAK1232761.1 Adenylosuccinate lyase (PurB) [Fructobacillus sp. LMG 32999]CAK1232952.1 Adenylosuccinate lyase (PurB) [Fructobacillus sp. LMG 32999]CAK1234052.1 Adenylosuccinate lyase (PurB) [Fructobacillus sp. LMG 32999]
MLDRYSRPAMRDIWSLQNQYQTWLDVEIAIDEAWSKLGEIPAEDVEKIRQNATFDVARIEEIEAVTHHDIVAFTRTVSESLGEEKKWVHFGITSTDVVDTAYGVRLKQANAILEEDLENFIAVLKKKAIEYKDTVMIGRTHGVQAEPTTFGLKIARFYSEMERNLERFKKAARGVEAGKISGAVGTFANIPPEIEQYVCERLGLHAQEISSQVLPRDLHADYMATLALIASSMEGFAVEIRSLQRSEIHEVEEKFAKGQKGSSAMPHKRNPIGSENICGLARVVRGQMVTAYENIPLWHERDISHSSAERMILPDSTSLLDYMLNRFMKIIDTLTVFPERMKSNMNLTHGLIYSQRVLLKLIETGMARETAYDLVQPLTAKSWDEGRSFKELVGGDKTITAHLSQAEIDDAFDYHYHLSQVDTIFKRLGLTD